MTLLEIIKNELAKGKNEIEINYSCGTTFSHDEYIDIKIGDTKYDRIEERLWRVYTTAMDDAVNQLKAEYPHLHTIKKLREFHFYYSGFNSCFPKKDTPVAISNKDPQSEPTKTGKVTEKYQLVGTNKVMEVINAHPDYELYKRAGYSFRGAQERRTDLEGIKKLCDWACCLDIEVRDNEIHVNGFSVSDMD